MAILYADDIQHAKTSDARQKVIVDGEEAKVLKENIKTFIEESVNVLVGDSWDLLRTRLNACCDVLTIREQTATNLVTAIDTANQILETYMDGDSKLDDATLPDLEAELGTAKRQLAILKEGTIVHNSKTGKEEKVYDTMAIENTEKQIKELEKMIEKLERLKPTDASAYGVLTACDLSSYQTAVNNLDNA